MRKILLSAAAFLVLTGYASPVEKKLKELHSSLEALKEKLESLSAEILTIKRKLEPKATEELTTAEEVAEKFGVNLAALQAKYPGANFYDYTNRVGGYKSVTLVRTKDGKALVLGKCKPEYESAYNKIKEKQKRPNIDFFTLAAKNPGDADVQLKAGDFMGSQGIDPRDPSHINQLAEIGMAFTLENDTFDPNAGNILVKDGELYYIDQDLTYASQATLSLNLLKNIEASMEIAAYFLPDVSLEDLKTVFISLINAYQNEVKKLSPDVREKFKEDYEKSKDFKDEWENRIEFKKELDGIARRISKFFGENNAWNAPQTLLEKFIVDEVGKVFNVLEK